MNRARPRVGRNVTVATLAGIATRNVIDVHLVDTYIVRVDSQGDARWSLGVAEVP
ncbi:hypothetical protein G3T36_12780 [Diaminobutyricibacter tongyongensis]|uniref:Uncharacterized protein n=1 Tax=Leifsonia tongyongensis TaxID=1268043 RepID=A0A6L9XZA6_9MICO|nr:hypothetical protein [Diaminobutyricibacter tongyongensis]NEN06741.1 hypothetical protein [Diaminobutyricibacter tongyongensis]